MKYFMQLLAEEDQSVVGVVQTRCDSSLTWTFTCSFPWFPSSSYSFYFQLQGGNNLDRLYI